VPTRRSRPATWSQNAANSPGTDSGGGLRGHRRQRVDELPHRLDSISIEGRRTHGRTEPSAPRCCDPRPAIYRRPLEVDPLATEVPGFWWALPRRTRLPSPSSMSLLTTCRRELRPRSIPVESSIPTVVGLRRNRLVAIGEQDQASTTAKAIEALLERLLGRRASVRALLPRCEVPRAGIQRCIRCPSIEVRRGCRRAVAPEREGSGVTKVVMTRWGVRSTQCPAGHSDEERCVVRSIDPETFGPPFVAPCPDHRCAESWQHD
jgi:hypothetical protein